MSLDVITFGCRLNAYESEVIRRTAGERDAVVVNTCAVTAEAVRQARQTIRKIRREQPSARIVVTGCAAQTEPETFADMPEVDHVLGNEKNWIARSARTRWRKKSRRRQHHDGQGYFAAFDRRPRARPRHRAGTKRLRPSLHVCIIPMAAEIRVPCRWMKWWRKSPPRRERLSRSGAHRRRYHELQCTYVRHAGQENPQRRAGPAALAAVLDRFRGGRRRPARLHC